MHTYSTSEFWRVKKNNEIMKNNLPASLPSRICFDNEIIINKSNMALNHSISSGYMFGIQLATTALNAHSPAVGFSSNIQPSDNAFCLRLVRRSEVYSIYNY